MNDTLMKIQKLMNERNWSLYKLAKESDIPYSSLNSLFLKNNQPTLSTLEKICKGFHRPTSILLHILYCDVFDDCRNYTIIL